MDAGSSQTTTMTSCAALVKAMTLSALPAAVSLSSTFDGCEIRHTLYTRRCRNDLDAARSVEHDFFQRARTAHDVRQGIRRPQSQQHVDVGEAEFGIEQCHLISGLRASACELHRGVGLTHTSLAARDGDDLDWARAHPLPQAFGLVGLE